MATAHLQEVDDGDSDDDAGEIASTASGTQSAGAKVSAADDGDPNDDAEKDLPPSPHALSPRALRSMPRKSGCRTQVLCCADRQPLCRRGKAPPSPWTSWRDPAKPSLQE